MPRHLNKSLKMKSQGKEKETVPDKKVKEEKNGFDEDMEPRNTPEIKRERETIYFKLLWITL